MFLDKIDTITAQSIGNFPDFRYRYPELIIVPSEWWFLKVQLNVCQKYT